MMMMAKDRLVVKVVHIKNCEQRLARMEEQLQQCVMLHTSIIFNTPKPSLESKHSLPIIPVQLLHHLRCHSFQNM